MPLSTRNIMGKRLQVVTIQLIHISVDYITIFCFHWVKNEFSITYSSVS